MAPQVNRSARNVVVRAFRALGRAIRSGAEPAGIGLTATSGGPGQHINAAGGAMMADAGRRAGEQANEGSTPDEQR